MANLRTPVACVCGCAYEDFKTGLTFRAVRAMLWDQPDPNRPNWYRQKRRSAVLGLWREMKIGLFRMHHGYCERELAA